MLTAADVATGLQNFVGGAFVLLGLVTAVGWVRRRERSLGFLAMAIVLLAAVSLASQIRQLTGLGTTFFGVASAVGFMASGYALLRFRAVLVPMSRTWHRAALTLTALATIALATITLLSAAGTPVGFAALLGALLVWSVSVGEPVVRFWQISRVLPAVQRMRLRSL